MSYSHDSEEHRARVLELAERLRGDGIHAWLDRYEMAPPEGWPRWMQRQVEGAHLVLVICTETYKRRFDGEEQPGVGRGATWEGLLATQQLFEADTVNRQVGLERHDPGPRILRDLGGEAQALEVSR